MSLLPKKRMRRAVLSLQLVAMVDIFSIIIIFLVKGTVFGVSDITVPPNVRLPLSVSKEAVESAPSVMVSKTSVKFSLIENEEFPISAFKRASLDSGKVARIQNASKNHLSKIQNKNKTAGTVLLNIIADRETPYEDVYDTLKVFRAAGFETILFVAHGVASTGG